MKHSPIAVFKGVVIAAFIGIVLLCAFRNYPQSETLTIVRDTTVTSAVQTTSASGEAAVQTASASGEAAAQTTQSKAVTSVFSEPELIIPAEAQTESGTLPELPDESDDTFDEPTTASRQKDILSVEKSSAAASVSEASQTTENSRLININTATAAQLKTLSGIGDVKAQAIIDYRELHGDFASVDELTKVNGIGEKTLEKIRDDITV